MEEKEKRWKGKKVFLQLKNQRMYSGLVLDEDFTYLMLRDKYGKLVQINLDEISVLQEEM